MEGVLMMGVGGRIHRLETHRTSSGWTWDRLSWCGQSFVGMPEELVFLETELVRIMESEGVPKVDPMRPIPLMERLGKSYLVPGSSTNAWTLADGSFRISCDVRISRARSSNPDTVRVKARGKHAIAVATCCAEMLRVVRGDSTDDLSSLASKCAIISGIEWS